MRFASESTARRRRNIFNLCPTFELSEEGLLREVLRLRQEAGWFLATAKTEIKLTRFSKPMTHKTHIKLYILSPDCCIQSSIVAGKRDGGNASWIAKCRQPDRRWN